MRHLYLAGLAMLAASCQSMSEGFFALEARGIVLDDNEFDEEGGGGVSGEDVDLTGIGLHAAFMTPILDITGGVDRREYEDENADEVTVGVRRRFLELWRLHPYVEGNLRYSLDLDDDIMADDYFGWSAGVGTLLDLTDHLFLNVRVVYETLDLDGDMGMSADVDGIVGTVGLGLAF